jgi:hypothetical protein
VICCIRLDADGVAFVCDMVGEEAVGCLVVGRPTIGRRDGGWCCESGPVRCTMAADEEDEDEEEPGAMLVYTITSTRG